MAQAVNEQKTPTVVVIGATGNGKSSLANFILGSSHFKESKGSEVGTTKTDSLTGVFLSKTDLAFVDEAKQVPDIVKQYIKNRKHNTSHPLCVIDSIGLENQQSDWAKIKDMASLIRHYGSINRFALVINSNNTRTAALSSIIKSFGSWITKEKLLGNIVFVFTHWELSEDAIEDRKDDGITKQDIMQSFCKEMAKAYPQLKWFGEEDMMKKIPCIFTSTKNFRKSRSVESRVEQLHELVKFYNILKSSSDFNVPPAKTNKKQSDDISSTSKYISYRDSTYHGSSYHGSSSTRSSSTSKSSSSSGGCFVDNGIVNVIKYDDNDNGTHCGKLDRIEQCLVKSVNINDFIETKYGFKRVFIYQMRQIYIITKLKKTSVLFMKLRMKMAVLD